MTDAPAPSIKAAAHCGLDLVALGEVMLRLDPGATRIRSARRFEVWEGGGEYNVARALSRCFGLRTGVVTALADNEIGQLIKGLMLAGGVDLSAVVWAREAHDGRALRNGLNFTERGFGVRGALGVSDRSGSAAAAMTAADVDWGRLFALRGVRWLHTGGIFAAISESASDVVRAAVAAAHETGTVVSYDLNFRPSLWRDQGRALEVNSALVGQVDVLLGNEEDFTACLGLDVAGVPDDLSTLNPAAYRQMIELAADRYPNLSLIATTLRSVRSASRNDWGAVAWSRAEGFVEATSRPDLEILDRVGGGDSFASGLIYGLMAGMPLREAIEVGAAHGALAMTTPGDASMADKEEVLRLAAGGGARVRR
ncbi:MAG: sugar kinase [Bifidobacteriaceae bacterium]|jgi:2-dehydro-3-deoxygluconokinase|nr:sugar kinase [Bifidobacteriaceae bacterium]